MQPNGVILWEGPSKLDGAQIVVIATGIHKPSQNAKTGDMVQTWILRADVPPHVAQQSAQDLSVCGMCPARPALGGHCYVATHQAPLSVWRKYKRGGYQQATLQDTALLRTKKVRAGSYGDPAAAPWAVWAGIRPHTGYTHQWRQLGASWSVLFMAPCDNDQDLADARAAGWRAFIVQPYGKDAPEGAIECVSESRGVSCADCGLCKGTRLGAKDIYIAVHGARKSRFLQQVEA